MAKEKCVLCEKVKENKNPELSFICAYCIKIAGKEYKQANDIWEYKHFKTNKVFIEGFKLGRDEVLKVVYDVCCVKCKEKVTRKLKIEGMKND